jgi:hypothetical protein
MTIAHLLASTTAWEGFAAGVVLAALLVARQILRRQRQWTRQRERFVGVVTRSHQ